MVRVSFPGVYVNEISSGSHTITGVATSIPVFVGMTKDGPVNTPTTVLGFTDFTRTFSADTSQGELPDQVRQFFLNGGTQAIIVRIAAGAASSTVTLKDAAGTNVLVLQSISAGSDQNALRATVDYNTATPESTFNLTLFRETLDSAGNATDSNQETISNLSMNPADPRYVVNVMPLESKLAAATVPTGAVAPTGGGVSIGATLAPDMTVAIANAIATAGGVGNFRVTLSNGNSQIVSIPTANPGPLTIATDVQGALDKVFQPGTVVAAEVGGTGVPHYLSLTVTSVGSFSAAGIDIQVSPAPSGDIAALLGLGAPQGGIEISSFAPFRPVPSGIVATLNNGSDLIGNLITLGNTPRADWASGSTSTLTMTGPQGFTMAGSSVVFPATGTGLTNLDNGNAVPGQPLATSLLNVQQNLQALAAAINQATTNWHASLQGYRLAVIPTFGNAQSGPGNQFPNVVTQLSGVGPLLTFPTQPLGFTLTSGSDGTKPTETQYDAAYAVIASQVDIFNLLILPRSVGDTADDRSAFWGPASSFCLQERAFLIMDLALTVTTVTQALTAVKAARLGLVKDHAATYWPRLQVNPDGNPRNIDPSGTLAGIMARIDGTRGVWKAPAGLEASLTGVLGVTTKMSDAENGEINPEALNAIRVFPNGIVSWGARTMDGFDNSGDDDFKYIPVRRFELFIESSLVAGLRFAVFEPNAEPLWSTIRLSVTAFMNNLFRQGAFAGTTTRDSFFVKVDSETTTATDINLGIVNVVVGFAPLKPAEFVVITIQQQAGQVQV